MNMTYDSIIEYFKDIGWPVEILKGNDSHDYIVIKDYKITTGSLMGKVCDVAVQRVNRIPFMLPPAIHTNPHLVKMDMHGAYRTQNSPIGPKWQYWSRRLNKADSPKKLVALIATIFREV